MKNMVSCGMVFLLLLVLLQQVKGIINGTIVNEMKKFPHIVQVHRKSGGFLCSGALISVNCVLTSAHCVWRYAVQLPVRDLQILAGSTIIEINNSNRKNLRNVAAVRYHPNFKGDLSSPVYDMAVIRLQRNYTTKTQDIKVIGLADHFPLWNMLCTIAGWGSTQPSANAEARSQKLMSSFMNIVPIRQCPVVIEYAVCISSNDSFSGSCWGDDGGPLICKGKLFGVVWGCDRICDNKPELTSNVYPLVTWIKNLCNKVNLPPQT